MASAESHFVLSSVRANAEGANCDGDDYPPYACFDTPQMAGKLVADPLRGRVFFATNVVGYDWLVCPAPLTDGPPTTMAADVWKSRHSGSFMTLHPLYRIQCALLPFSGEVLLLRRDRDAKQGIDIQYLTRHDPANRLIPTPCRVLESFYAQLAQRSDAHPSYHLLETLDAHRVWMHPVIFGQDERTRLTAYILSFGDETRTQVVLLDLAPNTKVGFLTFYGFASYEQTHCVVYESSDPARVTTEFHYFPLPPHGDMRAEVAVECVWVRSGSRKTEVSLDDSIARLNHKLAQSLTSQQCGRDSPLRVISERDPALSSLTRLVVRDRGRQIVAQWRRKPDSNVRVDWTVCGVCYAEPGILYVVTMAGMLVKKLRRAPEDRSMICLLNGEEVSPPLYPQRVDRLWLRHIDWHVARGYPGLVPMWFIRVSRALAWLRWREHRKTMESQVDLTTDPASIGLWGSLPLELFEQVLAEAWRAFLAPMVINDVRC